MDQDTFFKKEEMQTSLPSDKCVDKNCDNPGSINTGIGLLCFNCFRKIKQGFKK